jgi:hypothetical protein
MRRRSNASWAVGVIAPWCLSVGVLVSFTASAGQDAGGAWSRAPLTSRLGTPAEEPSLASALYGDFVPRQSGPRIELARLTDGGPFDLHTPPDEREPHIDIKPNAKEFPQVDRSHKGDPVVAMRPSFDSRRKNEAPEAEREAAPPEEPQTTTQKSGAAALPDQAGSASTPAPAAVAVVVERAAHGATPQVPRAVALGSSTPARPDAVPIEVASFPRATFALPAPGGAHPDYASLIEPEKMNSEKRCLAEAVYFESRSEPAAGQAAVAQVVLNRVSSGLYPGSICGVVYQNRHHYKRCQFSFACEGKSLRITERESWATAVRVADEVLAGRAYITDVGRSTHYHANYVKPRWARRLTKMDVIGRHIFYRLKPGQS